VLTDASLTHVACCKDLEELHIMETLAGDATLLAVATNCAALKTLHIHDNNSFGDAGIAAIAAQCPQLEVVDIQSCGAVTDDGIAALKVCKKLHELGVYAASSLAHATIVDILTSCSLDVLYVRRCPNVDPRLAENNGAAAKALCPTLDRVVVAR
jgi:hypothetical protein